MAAGTTSPRGARPLWLGFLLGANLLALLFLVQRLVRPEAALQAQEAALLAGEDAQAGGAERDQVVLSPPLVVERKALPRRAAPRNGVLAARIEGLIADALRRAGQISAGRVKASNCRIAVSVLDPAGRALLARGADRALRPASNMKLVTSAAALVLLGADWHFVTRFESSAPIVEGVLQGDLVVRAGADPFFDAQGEGRVVPLLRPATGALRELGIHTIAGDLVLDEGSYLVPGPAPGWPDSHQYWQEHCALAAGLTANASCLTAVVEARAVGALAFAELRPNLGGLARSGTVKTVSAKTRLKIAVGATARKATLRGVIPAHARPWSQRFSHPDPPALFAAVLREALVADGITLAGQTRRERGAPAGETLTALRTPLTEVLEPINSESNNAVADQLFYALGNAQSGAGTRAGAQAAVRAALDRLGLSSEGLVQIDGSGLSRDNRVTARQLTALLHAVLSGNERTAQLFRASLAVAGRKGSLKGRMRGSAAEGRVFAKTGWIRGTSALSGYVQTPSGELLCFSILIDYPDVAGLNTQCWKPLGDGICALLAESGEERSQR